MRHQTYRHKPPISVSFQGWWFRDSFIRVHNIVSQKQVNWVLRSKIDFQTHWQCTLKQSTNKQKQNRTLIGYFWVACCLHVKKSLCAIPFTWKCVSPAWLFLFKPNSYLHEKVLNKDLFSNRRKRPLGKWSFLFIFPHPVSTKFQCAISIINMQSW